MKTILILLAALFSISAFAGPRQYQCYAIANGNFCGEFSFKTPLYTDDDLKALAVPEGALQRCPGATFNLYKRVGKEIFVFAEYDSNSTEIVFGPGQFPSKFEISTRNNGTGLKVSCRSL